MFAGVGRERKGSGIGVKLLGRTAWRQKRSGLRPKGFMEGDRAEAGIPWI